MVRLVVASLLAAFLVSWGVPATAAVVCHSETRTEVRGGKIVTVVVQVCEEDGTGDGDGDSSSSDGSSQCSYGGRQIACTRDGLIWIASRACYAMSVSDWFEHGDDEWQGHTDGSLWNRMGVGPDQRPALDDIFWLPEGGAPPPPDPRELAEEAFGQMQLATPSIRLAPTPPLKTYVGLDTWLWMPPAQWATLTNSVKVRDTSVSVTAKVVSARWDMGPGSVGCPSAGRPWVKGMSDSITTDCSYTYKKVSDFQPDKKFKVSVHLQYQVDWACSGECLVDNGTLGINSGPSAGSAIRVGERQSVVVG